MVFNVIALFVGSSLIGWAVVYACWARVRATYLRQSLFAIRDELWDAAREIDALDDPMYRQTREHMNSVIAVADLVTIDALLLVGDRMPKLELITSDRDDVCKITQSAREKAADAVMTYVLFRTLSGLIFIGRQIAGASFRSSRIALVNSVNWLISSSPDQIVRESHARGIPLQTAQ